MQNKNRSLTAREKRWREYVVSCGCVIGGGTPEIHHLFGSSAKVKTFEGTFHIGEIASIPLSYMWHRDPSFEACVDLYPREFEKRTGQTEKGWWLPLALDFGEISDTEINLVMNYSKSNGNFGFDIDEYRRTNELPELLRVA